MNTWEKHANLFDDAEDIIVEDAGALHSKPDTFGKSPAPLIHDKGITDGACRLYAHMHWRYGRNQKNFEGRGSIAEILGVSETTITNRVKELEAADWVVVIERRKAGDAKTFLSHFYHVFEMQADARRFRELYKPRASETVRAKPERKVRKSRKGTGGKPKHKTPAQTQVETDIHVNSSSHGSPVTHVNSSSHYPDSVVYPDALIVAPKKARVSKPKTKAATVRSNPVSRAEQHPERTDAGWEAIRQQRIKESEDQTNREIARQRNFNALEQVVKILPGVSGKLATQYAHMLNGTATKGVYSEYRIEGGITAIEFEAFVCWYRIKYSTQGMPKEVEKLYGYVMEWIDAGKPAAPSSNGHKSALDRAYEATQQGGGE